MRHRNIRAQRYRLAGTGKILGEFEVGEAILDGLVSIGGNLVADRVQALGTLEVGGDLRIAESLSVRGALRVDGELSAATATLRGTTRIGAEVRVGGQLDVRGSLEVPGDLACRFFTPNGRVLIGGTLKAREIAGSFDGESRVGTIESANVVLGPKSWVRLPIDLPPLRPKGTLQVDRIEAESVDLEGVAVHYLKSPTIILRRYCHVAQLEGHVVRCDRTSRVGFESRSPPPPGLSR